jgi:anionic cell wall polymer biosynthesis LytR-Cps2A-Psr (LCP) family protein
MKRQQTFISAMIKKVVSAGTLANPVRLISFLNAATGSLTTDPGFANLQKLASLGRSLKSIGLDHVKFVTVPWEPWTQDPNRVQWQSNASQLWRLIRRDKPLTAQFDSEAVTPGGSTATPTTSTSPSGSPSGTATGTASPGNQTPSSTPTKTQAQLDAEAHAAGLCA